MIAYTNYMPIDYFEITKDLEGTITVTLYKNVKEIEDVNGLYYMSDSTSLVVENKDNLEDYIKSNFEKLFSQGLEEEVKRQIEKEKLENVGE
jgi:tRNA A37 N6-isopentenylltransferase MiaA